jgi:predicted metal-binding membrane protein
MSGAALDEGREPRPSWRLVLERERRITTAALLLVAAAAWSFVLAGAGMPDMGGMDPNMVMAPQPWSPGYAALIFLMWWIMMAAMMLPSAAPAILLYDLVARRTRAGGGGASFAFASGYLLVWGGFSLAAALLHWGLDQSGLLTMAMAAASPALGGAVLIAAGLWQLTPIKRACLVRCQSPIQFLSHRWRRGRFGSVRMGVEHGLYCLGCCWAMMGLLFYGGVMNPAWIGGLALYVLVEKTVPAGHWLSRAFGWALLLIGAGALVAVVR